MDKINILDKDINKIADSIAAKEFKKICKNSPLPIYTNQESKKPAQIIPDQKILIKIKKALSN